MLYERFDGKQVNKELIRKVEEDFIQVCQTTGKSQEVK